MQIHVINVSIADTGEQEAELNRFLSSHKVLEVEQRFFQNEKGCYWSFCVRYITDKASNGAPPFSSGKGKPDYRQILDEATFAVFSRLREIRKALATDDGVPAYAPLSRICNSARNISGFAIRKSILESKYDLPDNLNRDNLANRSRRRQLQIASCSERHYKCRSTGRFASNTLFPRDE